MFDILIVGAGPIGLFLSHLLGRAGLRTLILERQREISPFSRAIGITPPSLHLLHRIGLDSTFIKQGVPIGEALVFGSRRRIARLDLSVLPRPYNFILSLPQAITQEIFETELHNLPTVVLEKGCGVDTITDHGSQGIEARYHDHAGREHTARARLVIGCDGEKSTIRTTTGIRFAVRPQRGGFVMADTDDTLAMGASARLYFTDQGAIESFPLPQGKRRWIAQVADRNIDDKERLLAQCIYERTGAKIPADTLQRTTTFGLKSAVADRYFAGNVILCGDACHLMSPVGGQGMNTGFGDAYTLSQILIQDHGRQALVEALIAWQARRQKAVLTAIRRAAVNGWIGTRTGAVRSGLRSLGIGLALNRWTEQRIANHFAMWTIPYSNFRHDG